MTLSPSDLQNVLSRGDVRSARNPNAVLMARISEVQGGRGGPPMPPPPPGPPPPSGFGGGFGGFGGMGGDLNAKVAAKVGVSRVVPRPVKKVKHGPELADLCYEEYVVSVLTKRKQRLNTVRRQARKDEEAARKKAKREEQARAERIVKRPAASSDAALDKLLSGADLDGLISQLSAPGGGADDLLAQLTAPGGLLADAGGDALAPAAAASGGGGDPIAELLSSLGGGGGGGAGTPDLTSLLGSIDPAQLGSLLGS